MDVMCKRSDCEVRESCLRYRAFFGKQQKYGNFPGGEGCHGFTEIAGEEVRSWPGCDLPPVKGSGNVVVDLGKLMQLNIK